MPTSLEHSAVPTGLEKVSFQSNPKESQCQRMFKLPQISFISQVSKVMLKILQHRLQQYVSQEFQMFKLDLVNQRNQISNCQHLLYHRKSKRITEEYLLLLYWLLQSLWLCGSQQTGKFLKRWEYQTTWPASWDICMQVRKHQLELDMDQQTGSR